MHRGYPIFVRTDGDPAAAPLLLIHGFPTASWDWAPVWAALAQRYRVLALDMLGFGFSAKPVGFAYRISDQADLLIAFLQAEGVAGYHVLAHDYGDTVAQELLARAAEADTVPRLQGICLLNGGLFPEAHHPLLIQRLLASPLGPLVARLSTRTSSAASMRRIFSRQRPPTAEELDGFWELISRGDGRAALPALSLYRREREQRRARWVGALQTARLPVRFIVGTDDPIAGSDMAQRYRELVPEADIVELDGVGHYPQIEAPERVLQGYLEFRAGLIAAA